MCRKKTQEKRKATFVNLCGLVGGYLLSYISKKLFVQSSPDVYIYLYIKLCILILSYV